MSSESVHESDDSLLANVASTLTTTPDALRLTQRPPSSHQSNRLYDLQHADKHLIVKEYLKPDEFADAPRREFRALTVLRDLDIAPTPVALLPETTAHGPLVIYAFMDGVAWDRHAASARDLREMADAWVTMNAVSPRVDWASRHSASTLAAKEARFQAAFEAYHAWASAHHPPAEATAALCLSLLAQRRAEFRELADYDPPLRFARADPRFANVIRRPDGRIGFVDWEDSGLTDPAIDIADLMTHPNQEDLVDLAAWRAFIAYYRAQSPMTDPHLERRIALYYSLFPFFWMTLLLQTGKRRMEAGRPVDWPVNGMPAAQRLQRLLARALAWPALDPAPKLAAAEDYVWFP